MSVTIPQEYAAFIRDSVASGRFRSEDEVVFEALRLLQRREQKPAALRGDIQVGLDDLDAGDASELDVEDIIRRGRERMKKSL
ncbi:MAG: type II toxin-antitoxin system ParD family antitoxin [Planctomycetota bacterium]|jgi:antitoxin ParD1/3/4|nr:MAG: type II toxin-antitoxin system ParD family antitoxin [Planctomycetota bacterium]